MENIEKPKFIYQEISNFSALPAYFIQDYHTHLLCLRGYIEFKFNGKKLRCDAGNFLFWFAASRVTEVRFSKNFKGKIFLVINNYLNENIPNQSWGIDATLYSREHPVKYLKGENDQQKILANFKNLYERFLEKNHHFYEEALRLQMQIFVLEMWHIFANEFERHKQSMQSGTLYEKFINLVQEQSLKEREVQFYAEKLNITPKYLNVISKTTSGITASEWIRRHTRERLIFLLENKTLNIAEIADEMAFSSRSFFTRYVKKILGMTPSEFRERMK